MSKGKILVAPLNWGLGHATRCIPIINELKEIGYEPIIASDGIALKLLKKEFPKLKFYELPELDIKYSKKGYFLIFTLLKQGIKFYKTYKSERKIIKKISVEENLAGIISDNRLGLYHSEIPNVIISHQLKVISGSLTWLSTIFHQYFISKYDECWVPDRKERPNMSGKLGHLRSSKLNLRYIGYLSRLEKKELPLIYDVLILISGPEPQRTKFEEIVLKKFKSYSGKAVMVRGVVEDEKKSKYKNNLKVINFLTSIELEELIQQSKTIISRSGYTSLMDFGRLKKNVLLIPTPGQSEQQYLAKSMKKQNIATYCQQHNFNLNIINDVKLYKGLNSLFFDSDPSFREALSFFERK